MSGGFAIAMDEDPENGESLRLLFQLVLRASVWLGDTGPETDVVEPAEEVESLGFLDDEYAMHSQALSWTAGKERA
jgi:hypothetical protein